MSNPAPAFRAGEPSTRRRALTVVFLLTLTALFEPALVVRIRLLAWGDAPDIVDRRNLQTGPRYFSPFQEQVAARWANGLPSSLEVLRQMESSSIFQTGSFVELDLSRLRR